MWCIGDLTEEYRSRMYELLDLYSLDYDQSCPVVCIDEKSKRILSNTENRRPIRMKKGSLEKIDDEYVRNGTCIYLLE
jgi:hypothetical protein